MKCFHIKYGIMYIVITGDITCMKKKFAIIGYSCCLLATIFGIINLCLPESFFKGWIIVPLYMGALVCLLINQFHYK